MAQATLVGTARVGENMDQRPGEGCFGRAHEHADGQLNTLNGRVLDRRGRR